jgi:hypothetical protein
MSQFASLAVSYAAHQQEVKMLARPIKDKEFLYAANVLSEEGSTTLVLGEFIFLELLRLGVTDTGQIDMIRSKFLKLDKEQKGVLALSDLQISGDVVANKVSSFERFRRKTMRSVSSTNLATIFSSSPAPASIPIPSRDDDTTPAELESIPISFDI